VRSVGEAVQSSVADDSGNLLLRKSIAETALRKLKEEICFAARRRGTEHAETGEGCEFERVVSCGSGERRWRTKLDFGSREPFDDYHRCATQGATPETVQASGILIRLRLLCCAEQLKTKRQQGDASPVGEETEVADAHEAFGEQMQEEATQEFIKRKG
jgi:hypothetical protein